MICLKPGCFALRSTVALCMVSIAIAFPNVAIARFHSTVSTPQTEPQQFVNSARASVALKEQSIKQNQIQDLPNNELIAQQNISSTPSPQATATTDSTSQDDTAQSQNGKTIAQSAPKPGNARSKLPSIVGTVQIRKPFKLFVQEQLIHNLSFRDTPVKEVIGEIARRGNLNIIMDKSASGKITGELHDVTLNEAMDSVLASAGLQSRRLDNNTVIVGTQQALVQLGLNRPLARAFKLSYAHPYDVAMILHASIFNRGVIPEFQAITKRKSSTDAVDNSGVRRERKTGGIQTGGSVDEKSNTESKEGQKEANESETNQISRLDVQRTLRGASRSQTQEGVGFNNAATDPGSQQIRAFQEIPADYVVDQNGGGAIAIPDVKNRQVIIVGTQEDIAVAEESIRLMDKRPRQVHIQASLVELNNQGIRELGATINVQGQGLSASIMGNSFAPLIQYLPGLGSPGNVNTPTGRTTTQNITNTGFAPALAFTQNQTITNTLTSQQAARTNVTPAAPGTAFAGLLGALLPPATAIAGVTPVPVSQSGFNFLTLGNGAGGRANIATLPSALNLNLNLLLQTNKAKLVANPSVVVVDNTETLITLANEVVHKVTSTVSLGVVTTNVELTKAGIFLNVLPKVAEDGFITMRLRPQVSTPLGPPQTFGTTVVTLLNVREIMSQEVRVKDGQTLVLGGLFTESEAAILAKVPYLAETPVLGALFRNSLKGRNRTELMLLLTPKLIEEESTALSESQPSTQM